MKVQQDTRISTDFLLIQNNTFAKIEKPKPRPCVYVIDFGCVRKIGVSNNFEDRLATLTSQFEINPERYLSIETGGKYRIERTIKRRLKPFLSPFGGITTETFTTSFNDCAKLAMKLIREEKARVK